MCDTHSPILHTSCLPLHSINESIEFDESISHCNTNAKIINIIQSNKKSTKQIDFSTSHKQESQYTNDSTQTSAINNNKNKASTSEDEIPHQSKSKSKSKFKSIASDYIKWIESLFDGQLSSIPIFLKYFAFHECIVLLCGGIYFLQSDIGVLCLSILPGLSIIGMFMHFFLAHFDRKKCKAIKSTFYSIKNYSVAATIFAFGLCSIVAIYHVNTNLSFLVPSHPNKISESTAHSFIKQVLQFPRLHHIKLVDQEKYLKDIQTGNDNNAAENVAKKFSSFNYRISFVGSIIAPFIEETFKFLLVSLTFPLKFIWQFAYKQKQSQSARTSNYELYCAQSLFIIFIALCGGCGIAIMENIGYLAACQWNKTKKYCLPNRKFDILGAGLARGIFSVPFHCVTACIMADILCTFLRSTRNCYPCFCGCLTRKWNQFSRLQLQTNIIRFVIAYPVAILVPVFLHSSFNYWMKGMPAMTGVITILGFSYVCSRISKKYLYLNRENTDPKDILEDSIDDSNVKKIEIENEENEIDDEKDKKDENDDDEYTTEESFDLTLIDVVL